MALLFIKISLFISTLMLTIMIFLQVAFNIFMTLCSILALGYIGFSSLKLIIRILKFIKNKRRRSNMNTINRLLGTDAGKIKTPTKDVKMKLRKLGGEPFVFPCKAVDPEYVAELQENAIEFSKNELNKIKMYDTKVMTIIEGCPEIFKNDEVLKHFKAQTPKDLVKTLMLSGEMDDLKAEIDKLGGFDAEDHEDIKN